MHNLEVIYLCYHHHSLLNLLLLTLSILKLVLWDLLASSWIHEALGLLDHRGVVTYHVVGVCKHIVEAKEFPCGLLFDSDNICFLGTIDDLKVIPWTPVLLERGCAGSSEEVCELVLVDVFKQRLLVIASFDLYLLSSFLI